MDKRTTHPRRSPVIPRVLLGVLALGICLRFLPSARAQEKSSPLKPERAVTQAEFEQLHQKLTKMSTEKVWSIPWQLSVRKARELAVKENKPVLLWISSNGGTHPLGPC